eukprot:5999989-Pleurochrysis_carterae.AAC.1
MQYKYFARQKEGRCVREEQVQSENRSGRVFWAVHKTGQSVTRQPRPGREQTARIHLRHQSERPAAHAHSVA